MTTETTKRKGETMEPQPRAGAGWDEFLAKYRITDIIENDGGWTVRSTSGKTYSVRCRMGMDRNGSTYFSWTCDCRATKRCRHIDAVAQMVYCEAMATDDVDCIEALERVM